MLTKQQLKKLDKYDWRLEKITFKESTYYFFVFPKDKGIFIKCIETKSSQEMEEKINSWIKTL